MQHGLGRLYLVAIAAGCHSLNENPRATPGEGGSSVAIPTVATLTATSPSQTGAPPAPPPGSGAPPPADTGWTPPDTGTGGGSDEDACAATEPVVLYVSPDDSNSMSAPPQVRDIVARTGALPSPWVLALDRPWEWFDYAQWDYPATADGAPALHLELAADAVSGQYTLQVALSAGPERAPTRDGRFTPSDRVVWPQMPERRAPVALTFVVDVSGSMEGDKLAVAQASIAAMGSRLQAGDVVSMVTWDEVPRVALDGHVATGPDDPALLAAVDGLVASGGTNLSGGLVAGYGIAERNRDPAWINRVVLISDGGANLGVTDAELIGAAASDEDQAGIYLLGIGVGVAGVSYVDGLMDVVTDLGRGAAVFVADETEVQRILAERFLEVVGVAARDVQIAYTLPPGFRIGAFSGEGWSTDPDELPPQHLGLDDAMVLHQTLRGCPDAEPTGEISVAATWVDPITFEARSATSTARIADLVESPHPQLEKGRAVYAFARAVGGDGDLDEARAAVDAGLAALPGDADLTELQATLALLP